jgi:hypothetical protein
MSDATSSLTVTAAEDATTIARSIERDLGLLQLLFVALGLRLRWSR